MSTEYDDLKMYLNKLVKTIETQSSFDFGNKRILNKTRVDDILCCIDVNFPEELKLFKKHGQTDKNVLSYKLYDKLIANIKIKPLFGTSSYAVNYREVVEYVRLLNESFEKDVLYIKKTYPNILEN